MRKLRITMKSVGFRCAPSALEGEYGLTSLGRIVRHYIKKYRPDAEKELDSFRQASSLTDAIQKAGMAINSQGKRFPHQWRLKQESLQRATAKLLGAIQEIQSCGSFDDLIQIVESTAGTVKGIGELYVYDTALRIGAYLGIYPNEVYLHAGTRNGARALGLNIDRRSIPISDLPREFRHLPAREVEDILCIYKERFP